MSVRLGPHLLAQNMKGDCALYHVEALHGEGMAVRWRPQATGHNLFQERGPIACLDAGGLDQPERPDKPHGRRRLAIQGIARLVSEKMSIHSSSSASVETLRSWRSPRMAPQAIRGTRVVHEASWTGSGPILGHDREFIGSAGKPPSKAISLNARRSLGNSRARNCAGRFAGSPFRPMA
jgi:hypothetical protein